MVVRCSLGNKKQGDVVECDEMTALPRMDREGLTEREHFG